MSIAMLRVLRCVVQSLLLFENQFLLKVLISVRFVERLTG
jgi:hypothetical protein